MSAAFVLHRVWAREAETPFEIVVKSPVSGAPPRMAFYRKYTEGMLRRYMNMSMEAGRVPSLLGRELFRAKVTSYQVQAFDDVVIFVHDVGKCLGMLDFTERKLIDRIALQEYTQEETARLLGLPIRSVIRRYEDTLDKLTKIFLDRGLLDIQKACQAVETVENSPSGSIYRGC